MDKTLICFLTDTNYGSLAAAKLLKIDSIIFLIEQGSDAEQSFDSLLTYIRQNMPSIKVSHHKYTCEQANLISAITQIKKNRCVVLDATNAPTLQLLMIKDFVEDSGIPMIYVDIDRQNYYIVRGREIAKHGGFAEISVDDIMAGAGTSIVSSSSDYYLSQDVTDFISIIEQHYASFRTFLSIIKTPNRIHSNFPDSYFATISLNYLKTQDVKDFLHIADALKAKGFIDYDFKNNQVQMSFKDENFRKLIMIFGSWLEAITYNCVKKISKVDDVESGVVFMWNADFINIKNEIDVMASIDSRLVYISCKDTQNLSTYMLNEIELYAEKLGGKNSIKIMVLSDRTTNDAFLLRAREMGIHVIYFNGNTHTFLNTLEQIIR